MPEQVDQGKDALKTGKVVEFVIISAHVVSLNAENITGTVQLEIMGFDPVDITVS